MQVTVPNSWGTAVCESNDCHEPGGQSSGGQFCSDSSQAGPSTPASPAPVTVRSWHLTSDPHFTPDPNRKPDLNRVFISDLMMDPKDLPAGLFVTDSPESWMEGHGYERPYVAEVEGQIGPPQAGAARVGHEQFMQGEMRTLRVLTIDEYARETFGEPGWVEEYFAPIRMFGDAPRKKMPKNYVGRPVSDMTPAEIKDWERKFKLWTERSR